LAYVKTITAFCGRKIEELLEENPTYATASSGRTRFFFTPDPAKTFNRGQTDYFLFGGRTPVHSFDTPKSMGEEIGSVASASPDWIRLDTPHDLHNGDGICFLDATRRLTGFYINRVGKDGRLFLPSTHPLRKTPVPKGSLIYRNHDQAFSNTMAGQTAERRIGLSLVFSETDAGFLLEGVDEDGIRARAVLDIPKEPAKNPARAGDVMKKQLGKLGSTMFYPVELDIQSPPYFLSAKDLNQLRRDLVQALEKQRVEAYSPIPALPRVDPVSFYQENPDFRANVANRLARDFYEKRGVKSCAPAFELERPGTDVTVMTTKHCIRYSLGQCPGHKDGQSIKPVGPLYLENEKGRFRIIFNCRKCEMEVRTSLSANKGGA